MSVSSLKGPFLSHFLLVMLYVTAFIVCVVFYYPLHEVLFLPTCIHKIVKCLLSTYFWFLSSGRLCFSCPYWFVCFVPIFSSFMCSLVLNRKVLVLLCKKILPWLICYFLVHIQIKDALCQNLIFSFVVTRYLMSGGVRPQSKHNLFILDWQWYLCRLHYLLYQFS